MYFYIVFCNLGGAGMRKKKIPLVAVILVGLLAVCLATGAIGVRVDTVPAATYEMLTHAASLARAESLEWIPADTVETLPRSEALTAEELLARLTAAGYTWEEAAALLGEAPEPFLPGSEIRYAPVELGCYAYDGAVLRPSCLVALEYAAGQDSPYTIAGLSSPLARPAGDTVVFDGQMEVILQTSNDIYFDFHGNLFGAGEKKHYEFFISGLASFWFDTGESGYLDNVVDGTNVYFETMEGHPPGFEQPEEFISSADAPWANA